MVTGTISLMIALRRATAWLILTAASLLALLSGVGGNAEAQAEPSLSIVPKPGASALAVWSGGSVEQLAEVAIADACDAQTVAANAPDGGGALLYVFGAPPLVNSAFLSAYEGGMLPRAAVALRCARGVEVGPVSFLRIAFEPSRGDIRVDQTVAITATTYSTATRELRVFFAPLKLTAEGRFQACYGAANQPVAPGAGLVEFHIRPLIENELCPPASEFDGVRIPEFIVRVWVPAPTEQEITERWETPIAADFTLRWP
jgi:hypothetical protein